MQQWQDDGQAQQNLVSAIGACLHLVFARSLEVPVLAMHHKDVLGELLATREFEVPDVVTVRRPACFPPGCPLRWAVVAHRQLSACVCWPPQRAGRWPRRAACDEAVLLCRTATTTRVIVMS